METEHRANYFELEEDEADVDIGSFGPVYDDCRSRYTLLHAPLH